MAEWRVIYKSTWADRKIRILSESAELHFIKLISVADDYGFIDGDEVLAQCYPRRPEITEDEIERRNLELVGSDPDDPVLVVYKLGNRTILHLPKFGKLQKIRDDRKKDSDLQVLVDSWRQMSADVSTCPPTADICGQMPPTLHTLHNTTKQDKEKELAAPPRPEKPKEEKPKKPRSEGQSENDQKVAEIIGIWNTHFGVEDCSPGLAGMIGGLARDMDRDWLALIPLIPKAIAPDKRVGYLIRMRQNGLPSALEHGPKYEVAMKRLFGVKQQAKGAQTMKRIFEGMTNDRST